MKKTFATLLMVITVALGVTSCNDDPVKPESPTEPTIASLTQTSWEGTYETTFTAPAPYGQQPMVLEWVVDFNTDSTGIVFLTLTTPISDPVEREFDMEYTYDGAAEGNLSYIVYGMQWSGGFVVDAINRTLTANLQVLVTLDEEDAEPTPFGGITTLHQSR